LLISIWLQLIIRRFLRVTATLRQKIAQNAQELHGEGYYRGLETPKPDPWRSGFKRIGDGIIEGWN
jgi:hypothetical protein